MANYLAIVESPAKVKTIREFLGDNREVDALGSHVRDLPKSQLDFDAEHGYEPKYITTGGKGDALIKLRKEVKKADKIYLITDPDHEREAISQHLVKALKLDEQKGKDVCRISFNEITKSAVGASFKSPKDLDVNPVNVQQTKRMLDRMVSYRISPLLRAKVKGGLSAGRMQSIILRMIYGREGEANAFIPEEYWSLGADLLMKGSKKALTGKYYGTRDSKGDKSTTRSKEKLDQVLKKLRGCSYEVEEVKKGERVKKAPIPFTISTLQQETSRALNLSTQKIMHSTQQLYEGVEVKGHGTLGLITYLRMNPTCIADEAGATAKEFVKEHYGADYVTQGTQIKKKNEKIQDTHEAIRPTDITLTPTIIEKSLQKDLFRPCQLIQKRFTTNHMASATYKTTFVGIGVGNHIFTTSASRLTFEGFMSVYVESDDEEGKNQMLGNLEKGTKLRLDHLDPSQHSTQPPTHYTKASPVKALEEQGIGRLSTYAPTITTIITRRYMAKESKNLYVTELEDVVDRIMKSSLLGIVDPDFTANMESLLDKVADGTVAQRTVMNNFYPGLGEVVQIAGQELKSMKIADEVFDGVCDLCGRQITIEYGPHGKFLVCPGLPDCKNTELYLEKIGVPCPKCGKRMVHRKTKKGRSYYGCEANPNCDFMSRQKPSNQKRPDCGSYMVEKGSKLLCFNETCEYHANIKKEQKKM